MEIVELKTNSQIIQCHCAGNFKLPVEDWQMTRTNKQVKNRDTVRTALFDFKSDNAVIDKI